MKIEDKINVYKEENYNFIEEQDKYDILEKDNYYYKVNIRNWKDGYRPNIVDKRNPFSINNIKNFFKINNVKSELISNSYKNNKTKLELKCKCGKIYFADWSHLQQGNNKTCISCSSTQTNISRRKNEDEIRDKIMSKGYEPIFDKYVNEKTLLPVKDKDGYIICVLGYNIDNSNFTHKFHAKNPYTLNNIKTYIKNKNISCLLLSTEYKNEKYPLKFQCACGKEYKTSLDVFLRENRYRCPKCTKSMSGLELKTEEFLKELGLNFEKQFRFNDCKFKRPLPFDFKVYYKNSYFLIEVDGIFHYYNNYGEEHLSSQQHRDEIKTNYCKSNNIPLLRIPYWEYRKTSNYKNILKTFMENL